MKKYWPALLSGLLMGTSFIPFPPWAILFSYVPLWIFVYKKADSLKVAFIAGWITQFVQLLIGGHWVYHVAREFGHLPWYLSLIGLLGFAAFVYLYLALSSALGFYLKEKFKLSPLPFFLVMAVLFSLSERAWPSIFSWNIGYTLLWAKLPAFQWADMIGFEGLTTLCLLVQAVVAWLWLTRPSKGRAIGTTSWKITLVGLLSFLFLINVSGHFHGQKWDETDSVLRPLLIQANIGNFEKVQSEKGRGFQYTVIDDHLNLIRDFQAKEPEKWQSVDLIIWPETAFPDFLDDRYLGLSRQNYLMTALKDFQKPLLTGGYSREVMPDRRVLDYNALFLFDSTGTSLGQPYRKTRLLIFGEYLPFSEDFPILLEWFPFIASFGRGNGPEVLSLVREDQPPLQLGSQICYEGLTPGFTRGLSEKGAGILVNVTNDSWFGKTAEPFQHMTITLARAIEVRRPLIRSTNTGISTAILANGKILEQSPLHTPWASAFEISYLAQPGTTFFVKYGHFDWIIWLALLFALLFLRTAHFRPIHIKLVNGQPNEGRQNGIQNSRLDGNQS